MRQLREVGFHLLPGQLFHVCFGQARSLLLAAHGLDDGGVVLVGPVAVKHLAANGQPVRVLPDAVGLWVGAGAVPLGHPLVVRVQLGAVQLGGQPAEGGVNARVQPGSLHRGAEGLAGGHQVRTGNLAVLHVVPHAVQGLAALQQPQRVPGLALGHGGVFGVAVEIGPPGHPGGLCLADVLGKLGVVLACVVRAVPQPQDGKLHPGLCEGGKVHRAVVLGDVHTFCLHTIPP